MSGTTIVGKRPRILQVMASGPGAGGIEKHFFELCNRLAADHAVMAVSHPAHAAGLNANVEFESLGRFIGRRNPATIFRLHRILKSWKPDLIHAHAGRAAAIVLQTKPFYMAPRVATVHGLKRSSLVFRGFDRVIAVSQGVANRMRGVRSQVIYNGIAAPSLSNPTDFKPMASRFGNGPIVISIGRLDAVKGFDVLVDAWQGVNGHLVIVGEGPQRRDLDSQIERLGLQDRVHLLGFRHDVPDLLAASDLMVIASRREGFGYSLAEALLLRRPVISTNVPAANEILPSQYLVPCGDAKALERAITGALADRDAIQRAFEPVWEQAVAQFTIDAMVTATATLYRDVLAAECPRLIA